MHARLSFVPAPAAGYDIIPYTTLTVRVSVLRRAATLEDRMQQLETLIQAIPAQVFAGAGALGAGLPQSPVDPTTNPHASFASSTHIFPTAVPPPSLTAYPLMNPSTFFGPVKPGSRNASPGMGLRGRAASMSTDQLADDTPRMSLASSYLYFDDEGYTRWQGETSGLPILDLLVERHAVVTKPDPDRPNGQQPWKGQNGQPPNDWFPDRHPRRTETNPEHIWKLITSFIVPELMDRCVSRCKRAAVRSSSVCAALCSAIYRRHTTSCRSSTFQPSSR